MGLFDYIEVEDEIELPKPDNFELKNLEFQTKSLDCSMSTYIIASDRCLYEERRISPLDEEVEKERKKIDFHGIIDFGAYEQTDLVDHFIDYQAKFTDGVLSDIKLIKYETKHHESIKKRLNEIREKQEEKINSFFFKLQKYLIIYPLKLFGFDFRSNVLGDFLSKNCIFSFHCPKIHFGFGQKISFIFPKFYGILIDQTTTDISFKKSEYSKEITFKILGFGFRILFFKEISIY